jgi:hypothetical protein
MRNNAAPSVTWTALFRALVLTNVPALFHGLDRNINHASTQARGREARRHKASQHTDMLALQHLRVQAERHPRRRS